MENINDIDLIFLTILLFCFFVYFYIQVGISVGLAIIKLIKLHLDTGKTETIDLKKLAIVSSLWPLVLVFVACYSIISLIVKTFYDIIVKKILKGIVNVCKSI